MSVCFIMVIDKHRCFMQLPCLFSFFHIFILCVFPVFSVFGGDDTLSRVESINIVEHGMYTIDPKSVPVTVSVGGVTNQVQPISEAKLLIAANHGLAVTGTCFGVRFVVTGQIPNSLAEIVVVVRHPPFKNAPGKSSVIEESTPWLYKTGEEVGYMYRLDGGWECVPGDWKIEIWHDGKKSAEQCFVLELPEKKNKGQSAKNGTE